MFRRTRSQLKRRFELAPREGFEPPYCALRPLRLINSQVSYQLEYLGIEYTNLLQLVPRGRFERPTYPLEEGCSGPAELTRHEMARGVRFEPTNYLVQSQAP